jgi:hypothetical protein
MDTQTIFNAVVGIAAFFGGWVLNNITKAIERLDRDVRDMPHTYITKDTYRRDIDELKEICGKIFDRLENKADK